MPAEQPGAIAKTTRIGRASWTCGLTRYCAYAAPPLTIDDVAATPAL